MKVTGLPTLGEADAGPARRAGADHGGARDGRAGTGGWQSRTMVTGPVV
ncbi:MAG: hypothetical protein ACRD1K_09110 [Acidimicrobiales bacterium]